MTQKFLKQNDMRKKTFWRNNSSNGAHVYNIKNLSAKLLSFFYNFWVTSMLEKTKILSKQEHQKYKQWPLESLIKQNNFVYNKRAFKLRQNNTNLMEILPYRFAHPAC